MARSAGGVDWYAQHFHYDPSVSRVADSSPCAGEPGFPRNSYCKRGAKEKPLVPARSDASAGGLDKKKFKEKRGKTNEEVQQRTYTDDFFNQFYANGGGIE